MPVQKLPYAQFVESFKLAPRIAIDLWIKNEVGGVLFTKRDKDPYVGMWHVPGSFLLLNETVAESIKRIAKEEVNVNLACEQFKLLQLDEDLQEPRGHVIHLVYLVRVVKSQVKESEKQKFYFEPPQPMIPTHRKIFLEIT
ncbi:NUDIX domain-containing protein [Candidatus Collierbacteria bacterium]|nr:NUDIX domain-containing protein [Candidatus Collierbacteria bacterium]